MPFADTDFLIALVKDEDWLKENATVIYKRYGKNIWTSSFAITELMLISKRLGLDIEVVISNIYQLVEVRGIEAPNAILAARYIKKYGATIFDAIHASIAQDDLIISSDRIYDEIGLDRLKLEDER